MTIRPRLTLPIALYSSLSGIQEIGIRFVWISVYKIGCGKTRPQALILMCITLTFLILATNVVMFSVGEYQCEYQLDGPSSTDVNVLLQFLTTRLTDPRDF